MSNLTIVFNQRMSCLWFIHISGFRAQWVWTNTKLQRSKKSNVDNILSRESSIKSTDVSYVNIRKLSSTRCARFRARPRPANKAPPLVTSTTHHC